MRVDPIIISSLAGRIGPPVTDPNLARARAARTAAVLFAFGALLTLVDAAMTSVLLQNDGLTESWAPVRALMDAIGIDLALAVCSALGVGALAVVAWAAVRARPPLASAAFIVLCAAVALRVCGCVNNFGVMLQ